jgi:hypothetical protein
LVYLMVVSHSPLIGIVEGLSIRVRLLRALPSRFKIDITLKPGSHQSELAGALVQEMRNYCAHVLHSKQTVKRQGAGCGSTWESGSRSDTWAIASQCVA